MFTKFVILTLAALPLVVTSSGVKGRVQEKTARKLKKKKSSKSSESSDEGGVRSSYKGGKQCDGPFVAYMEWTNDYILADGERTEFSGIAGKAYGGMQSYHMEVYDSGAKTNSMGKDVEVCHVLDDDAIYYFCQGTYFNLGGCEGAIYFGGSFTNENNVYTITGGTGEFKNAKGTVTSDYDDVSQTSVRTILLK